jgi:3-oxoacyl-[acyl-carrier protein] reductase
MEEPLSDLTGKTALVTGGSRGLGKAIVLALASEGADVALCYRSGKDAAEQTAEEARKVGPGHIIAIQADVTRAEDRKALISEVTEAVGRVDILVNNAGTTQDGVAMGMGEAWDQVLELNLTAAFRMSQLVIRGMMKRNAGRIINIGSIASRLGVPGQVNYAASKAGMEGMSRSLAQEYGRKGVTVNTVNPGFLETDLTQDAGEFARNYVEQHAATGRFPTPESVAAVVTFLASDAAWAVTGQTVNVDGGLVKS